MLNSLLLMLLAQVGPNPAFGAMAGTPEELRNRPPRTEQVAPDQPAMPQRTKLSQCLMVAGEDAEVGLDFAQHWRETVDDDLDMAQSAHCLGLALVKLGRFTEAQEVFALARDEAPADNPAYRARLGAMAGNAAFAGGDAATALAQFDAATPLAQAAGDAKLASGMQIDRARMLVALNRRDEAVAALADARSADPANVQAWLLSATLSRRLERLGEAQQQIQYAATLNPRDPAIGLEAGVIAAMAGRDADARRSFASVIDVAPDSTEAASARKYLDQLGSGTSAQ